MVVVAGDEEEACEEKVLKVAEDGSLATGEWEAKGMKRGEGEPRLSARSGVKRSVDGADDTARGDTVPPFRSCMLTVDGWWCGGGRLESSGGRKRNCDRSS